MSWANSANFASYISFSEMQCLYLYIANGSRKARDLNHEANFMSALPHPGSLFTVVSFGISSNWLVYSTA